MLAADERARPLLPGSRPATEADFATEFLALELAVGVVDDLDGAIAHIARYGSGHSEAIVTSRSRGRDAVRPRGRRGRRARQRLDAVHRRRRARPRGRGRHLDPEAARPRPDGPAGADLCQVRRLRRRADQDVSDRRRRRGAFRARSTRFERGLGTVGYLADDGLVGGRLPGRPPRQARPRRGSRRHGQDRARQVDGPFPRRPAHPAAVLRGPRRGQGALRVELQEAAAAHPGRARAPRTRTVRGPPAGSRSRRTSSPRSSCSPARCSRRSGPPTRSCCSSTRSTASRSRPRRSCSRCSRTTRSRSPSSARSAPTQIPLVFLTSNNTRELSEALKRRCLFLHLDYPSLERERAIVLAKVPGVTERARRPGGPHRPLAALARPEEAPLHLRDHRLGPDPRAARASRASTPRRPAPRLHILLKYRSDIEVAAKELAVAVRVLTAGYGRVRPSCRARRPRPASWPSCAAPGCRCR